MLKKDALILALVIGLAFTGVCDAKMYNWVDENGVLHLSDSPPPESISEGNSNSVQSEKSRGKRSNPTVLRDTIRNVIVYGRKGCGLTQHMMSGLKRRRVSYVFQSIDNHAVRT